jgi:hypothetical protein
MRKKREYINDELGTWQKGPDGFMFKFLFDDKGRLIRSEDRFGKWEVYTYNTKGEEVLIEYSDGSYLYKEFNEQGRIIFSKGGKGGEFLNFYTYTKSGKLLSKETNHNCYKRNEYDKNENVIRETWGDPHRDWEHIYRYDSNNSVVYEEDVKLGKWTVIERDLNKNTEPLLNVVKRIYYDGRVHNHSTENSFWEDIGVDAALKIKEETLKKCLPV